MKSLLGVRLALLIIFSEDIILTYGLASWKKKKKVPTKNLTRPTPHVALALLLILTKKQKNEMKTSVLFFLFCFFLRFASEFLNRDGIHC